MNKTAKFIIYLSVFLILILPIISLAAVTPPSILVPCNNNATVVKDSTGVDIPIVKCDFTALMTLVNNVINFILYGMAVPIAAIMFFYAGFELVTSGGSTEKRGIAKKVFTNTVIGLILAVAAFLIVKLILTIAGYTGPSLLF